MSELIAHFIGDYALQNHCMAMRKTSSSLWAAIHVAFYTLPFAFMMWNPFPILAAFTLPWSPLALAIIAGTHFFIDRYRLAGYWVRFYGIGEPGTLPRILSGNNGVNLPESAPPFLGVWLGIIVDNTFHITINHWALSL